MKDDARGVDDAGQGRAIRTGDRALDGGEPATGRLGASALSCFIEGVANGLEHDGPGLAVHQSAALRFSDQRIDRGESPAPVAHRCCLRPVVSAAAGMIRTWLDSLFAPFGLVAVALTM